VPVSRGQEEPDDLDDQGHQGGGGSPEVTTAPDPPEGSDPTDGEGTAPTKTKPLKWYEGWEGGEEGDTRAMRWFKFLFPIGLTLAVVLAVYVVLPYDRWWKWVTLAFLYLVPPAGKESIIPSGVAWGYHPMAMAGTVLLMDFVCALFIAWNFPLAKRIPGLGYYIALIERKGAKMLEGNPALQAGAWIGLVLFVMVPFQGSGGITASIVGRAVGMRTEYLVSAVAVGALTAGLIIAYLAEGGLILLRENLVTGIIIILLLALAGLSAYLLFRFRRIRKWEAENR
jgi:uncharacterized membrane protein